MQNGSRESAFPVGDKNSSGGEAEEKIGMDVSEPGLDATKFVKFI